MTDSPEAVAAARAGDSESHGTDPLDQLAHMTLARATRGLSPAAAQLAWHDWALHLAISPGKRRKLLEEAFDGHRRFLNYVLRSAANPNCPNCVEPLEQDRRFEGDAWQKWPFNVIHQGLLLQQEWWQSATSGVRGVSGQHEDMVSFSARQWLDMLSPVNFFWTNPEVLQKTAETGGANLWRGSMNWLEDLGGILADAPPAGSEDFIVGKDVGLTPGKVVFRNHLVELIQYAPTTSRVHATPVLIVPSWIMKYYILDLSPHNSMVRWLVDQGHTVFMISWRNPGSDDRDLGMEDYRRLGVMAALDAVGTIVPDRQVNAVGYCLGGTLLAIAAAAMARDGDERLRGMSLLAAEIDFREPGELSLFIGESQLAFLDSIMADKGYLDGWQMAGAFQLLNSQDLIWSRQMKEYLLGERQGLFDLMAWNSDTTRMPARMHSEYLRKLYLDNDFADGRYLVDGIPAVPSDIRLPVFAVGTVRDHVAPWKTVYKVHRLIGGADVTFALTSGGHNAGVVSEPGRANRSFQIATRKHGQRFTDPDKWREEIPVQQGSWWPAWGDWLATRSSEEQVAPPSMGATKAGLAPLGDAPGTYVLER